MKTCYFICSIVFRTPSWELLLVVCVLANASAEDSSFRDRVAPILEKHCLRCHNDEDKKGGLSFSTQEAALKGGESGQTFIAVTSHENPLLLAVVGDRPEMPKNAPPLSKQQVETLREWVDSGAIWPQRALLKTKRSDDHSWWSLVPLVRPNLPPRQDTVPNPAVGPEQLAAPPHQGTETKISAPLSPLDAFIQAKLASVKISPSPEADRRTLLRRLSFDLLGSPPDSEELDAFADDDDPFAYERRVDALLASPRFGERWSRHWLDAVHYGDTHGYDKDKTRPNAWPYRDYVIRAFNDDKPYDRFVVEQLAGDVLWPDSVDGNTATGFIAAGPWDYIGHAEVPESKIDGKIARNLDRDDMVTTAMNTFCSMTVQCARCHDHKFDPILQTDYYRLAATFWPGPVQGGVLGGPTKEQLGFDVLGWTDLGREAKPLHLLKKGDPHRPEQEVTAGALSFVPVIAREFAAPAEGSKTTGRRLQFAEWIVDEKNPLTARVAVNRLWLHHFGEGIVRSPDNFGFTGQKPTHAKLLDYLASELMAGGWKQKRLHKLLVMSRTYRQASVHPAQDQYVEHDPTNLYWWRANRQRLDAESLRDSILQTSGKLDPRQGGPSFFAPISAEALEGLSMKSGGYPTSPPEETNRRSIYMFTKRGLGVPLMTTFDACDTTMPAGRREVSIVAPQALALLNNGWVQDQSKAFAQRVMRDETGSPERADRAWRLAFGRSPSEDEQAGALAHVEAQQKRFAANAGNNEEEAWTSLCHVLLNANEFIYLD